MRNAYELHEGLYRRIREQGKHCWNEREGGSGFEVEPEVTRLLNWVLEQAWAPKAGKAVELGCGTGPMLRWLHGRGFTGLGVDVSATAIEMAREQSRGLPLRFRRADLCRMPANGLGRFDLAVDGHCLHCIVDADDRAAFLGNVLRLLKPGGVFVAQTMCAPVKRSRLSGQRLIDGVLYVPAPADCVCEGVRLIGGRGWLPTRRLAAWKAVLAELATAGFAVRHFRVSLPDVDEMCGTLEAIAHAPKH